MPRHIEHSSVDHPRDKQHNNRSRNYSPKDRFIKPEPIDEASFCEPSKWERNHDRVRRPKRGSSPGDRVSRREGSRRLKEPVVIKEENTPPKRSRLHSPKIIREDDDTMHAGESSQSFGRRSNASHSNSNLGRSGLLEKSDSEPVQKQRANFALSGKLTEDTNTYKGVVIKYNEPEDARKPTERWRLYAFKGNKALPILHIHRQSGFLIGRDRKIADIPMDHPSISKQHAVLQYRLVKGLIRLYLIDLESVNGTYLNNEKIEPRRYYELIEKDVIKFGFSTREYVVMTAQLDEDDDDEEDNA